MTIRDADHGAGEPANSSGSQSKSLQAFKDELTERGDLDQPPDLQQEDLCYGISDINSIHRFLTARKYCVADAVSHFEKASQFRLAHRLCALYDEMDVAAFEETRSMYPHWSGRLCSQGQPMYIFDTSNLSNARVAAFRESSARLKAQTSAFGSEGKATMEMIRAMLWFDHFTRFVIPLCSALSGRMDEADPTPKMILLVDLSGMSLKQIWNLKSYLQDFTQLLSISFPEILDQVFLTNAPGSFSFIWNMIKGWADPGTVSKIFLLQPSQVKETLRARIPVDDLPQKYGGNLAFEHGMPTVLGENLEALLEWGSASEKRLPEGPLKWTRNAEGQTIAAAVGSVEGQKRNERFATLRRGGIESQRELNPERLTSSIDAR